MSPVTGGKDAAARRAAQQRRAAGPQPPAGQPGLARYRIRLAKLGNARYLSHLETIRALLRAFRRAGLDLALSGGYNPQPKVAYATALAVGLESEAEFADLEFARPADPADVARRLGAALPPGFWLREVQAIPITRPALASYPAIAVYRAVPAGDTIGDGAFPDFADVAATAASLLGRAAIPVERQGRTVDLRPHLVSLDVDCEAAGEAEPRRLSCVRLELSSDPRGAARVDELLSLLGLDPLAWRVLKTDYWPLVEGLRVSPWRA